MFIYEVSLMYISERLKPKLRAKILLQRLKIKFRPCQGMSTDYRESFWNLTENLGHETAQPQHIFLQSNDESFEAQSNDISSIRCLSLSQQHWQMSISYQSNPRMLKWISSPLLQLFTVIQRQSILCPLIPGHQE